MYGYGRGIENYPFDRVRFGPLTVVAQLGWLWSLNLIRISMGFMLLRLKDERHWLWPLRVLIALQVCMIVVATGVQLSMCQPISAIWEPTAGARCLPPDSVLKYAVVYDSKKQTQHQATLPMKRRDPKANLIRHIALSLQRHQRPCRRHHASHLLRQAEPHSA